MDEGAGGRTPPRQVPLGVTAHQVPLPCGPGEAPPAPGRLPSLAAALARVPEPRRPRGYRAAEPPYPLVPLLLLVLVGVLCGRRGYGSIAEWAGSVGRGEPAVLDALGCPPDRRRRTPAAATLFRCLRHLDRAAFQAALQGWLQATAVALGTDLRERLDQIALDGKTGRGATARPAAAAGGHLVAAYAPALQVVLDQLETAGKGHAVGAAEALLGRLPLKGRVITGEALLTQRRVCAALLAGQGDDLLPVQENQPALLAALERAVSPAGAARGGGGAETAAARPAAGRARAGGAARPEAAARAAGGPAALDASLGGAERVPGRGGGSRGAAGSRWGGCSGWCAPRGAVAAGN